MSAFDTEDDDIDIDREFDREDGDLDEANGKDEEADTDDVERLNTAWRSEVACPELLPYEAELVDDIREYLESQKDLVEEQKREPGSEADTVLFSAALYESEIERIEFSLASYLRARLAKIERHALHILSSAPRCARLSAREHEYAKAYIDMLEQHFTDAALGQLPPGFRELTTEGSGPHDEMVDRPRLDEFVFCKIAKTLGDVEVDEQGERAFLSEGDVHVLRYRPMRTWVERGDVSLL